MGDRGSIFGQLFDLGVDVLVTSLSKATGVVSAQLGDSTAGVPDSDNAEWWQHAGFASRAAPPTQNGSSCQGLVLKCSDRDVVFASRDTRASQIYGNLAPGETCCYATTGQAYAAFKADGSARLATTDDNTTNGNTILFGISPVAQSGSPGGEMRFYAPWGGQWHDSTGWHLRTFHGVKVDAGGVVLPSPIGLSGSTLTLSADVVALDAAMLVLGRNNGTAQALLQALPSQAILASLATATEALAAAVAAFTGAGTFPGLPAAADAISAASAAVNGMLETCATKAMTSS